MSPIGRIFIVLNLILAALFLGWASLNLATSHEYKGKLEAEEVAHQTTKTDFEGVDISLQVGASTEGDKDKEDVNITVGGEFGNGGFGMLSVGYSDDDALRSRERSFSAFDLVYSDEDGDGYGEVSPAPSPSPSPGPSVPLSRGSRN